MGLIGKTTIKLFDAKTGRLSDMVKSSNMVTNAVSNIFNGALNALVMSDNNKLGRHNILNYLFDMPNGYNFAKTYFGGLLVFSGAIEEDVNHIIPTMNEMKSFIGCGNQGSSITDNHFKGNFNAAESIVGDNYVTFVWDFTTEQCNGDIASICLTSDIGGNLGYAFGALDAAYSGVISYIQSNMWDFTNSADYNSSYVHNPMMMSSFTINNEHGNFISDNNYYYVYRNKVYRYDIARLLNYIGTNITESFNYGAFTNYDEVLSLSNYESGMFLTTDDDKVYEVNTSQRKSASLDLLKIYKKDGVVVSETISIPTTNILTSLYAYHNNTSLMKQPLVGYRKNAVIHNDKIYFLTGRVNDSDLITNPNKLRMYILSFDGSFIYKDIDCTDIVVSMLFGARSLGGSISSNMGVKFIKIFDSLFLVSYDSTNGYKYFIVNEDGSISSYPFTVTKNNLADYGMELYKNSSWLKEPWCSFKFAGNGYFNSIELWNTYLATINNQETVLTKTADKTMKIIYTLSQA